MNASSGLAYARRLKRVISRICVSPRWPCTQRLPQRRLALGNFRSDYVDPLCLIPGERAIIAKLAIYFISLFKPAQGFGPELLPLGGWSSIV